MKDLSNTQRTDVRIKRHVVSNLDGTQQGGLAFLIALIGGMIVAASLAPGALTSFWVWLALLMLSVAVATGAQRLFARDPAEDAEQRASSQFSSAQKGQINGT
ncbi:hypothetical protein GCM10007385_34920 [Tateyamaria omphalii]|uniref:hypothetical protein n=1 Tax=Tateyamaria omphalii TaxID=299262 RepID=UPI00167BEECA|nr:hypothetical protein [Tateyamaria omphalii]GGX62807.1 hypothetical protein GCM10007385_34920 [Tateyamaria omphalii]